MNLIDRIFQELGNRNEGVFMPFVTLGDPDQETCLSIIKTLIENGADILELGIPFSDPIADGKTIQKSSQRALKNGMNTDIAFEMVRKIRKFSSIPIIFLTYYNLVLQYPLDAFFDSCKRHEVQGIVIPDLPIEEARPTLEECRKNEVYQIFLIAPNTSEQRLTRIMEEARGFLYFVSTYGTTGARESIARSTIENLSRFIASCELPIMPGFGISNAVQVRELMEAGASGVIVGSALINLIEKNLGDPDAMLRDIGTLSRSLKQATIRRVE
ncbi:MAG: tryptophan synthase subunit alpha [Candidatus Helarchaeales archaeon]